MLARSERSVTGTRRRASERQLPDPDVVPARRQRRAELRSRGPQRCGQAVLRRRRQCRRHRVDLCDRLGVAGRNAHRESTGRRPGARHRPAPDPRPQRARSAHSQGDLSMMRSRWFLLLPLLALPSLGPAACPSGGPGVTLVQQNNARPVLGGGFGKQ